MRDIILLDFGSTFTKMAIANCNECVITHSLNTPSTVRTDARICFERCMDSARSHLGTARFSQALKLASSSAAGGLRMAVIGLSHTLSATAARNAAFGAGARIVGTLIGKLTDEMIVQLQTMDVEIILFCGGYEDGASSLVEHNAKVLAKSRISSPIIYAGNNHMALAVRSILSAHGKECFLAPNIIPSVNIVDAKPTENIIRHVFMGRIVNMKGFANIVDRLDAPLKPTPASVLEAGELLSKGSEKHGGKGPLMIVDVGGATTDIHSYVDQVKKEGARLAGAPEPYARRTVEGDMGIRESSICLAEEVSWERLAQAAGTSVEQILDSVNRRVQTTSFVPENEVEQNIDTQLAANAVRISARRHAGRIQHIHNCNCKLIQYGKNISDIQTVIGTGGPLVNAKGPNEILKNICRQSTEQDILLPDTVNYIIDKKYILFTGGLIKDINKEIAMSIMVNHLYPK